MSPNDWDDFRSFGAYVGLAGRGWAMESTLNGLTNRADGAAQAGRVDLISLSLRKRILSIDASRASLGCEAGPGLLAVGNFGQYEMQRIIHHVYEDNRGVPVTYDYARDPVALSGAFTVFARESWSAIPIQFFSATEAATNAFFRETAGVSLEAWNGFLGVNPFAGFVYAGDGLHWGTSFDRTMYSERGFSVGAQFRQGNLEVGFAYDVTHSRPAGRAAIAFGGGVESKRVSPSEIGGKIRSLDIQAFPLLAGVKMRQSVIERIITVSCMIGAESGPTWSNSVPDTHRRYAESYAGVDAGISPIEPVEFFVTAAGGIREERLLTATAAAASTIWQETNPTAFVEAGARMYPFTKRIRSETHGLGVAVRVQVTNFEETAYEYTLRVSIVGTEGNRTIASQ